MTAIVIWLKELTLSCIQFFERAPQELKLPSPIKTPQENANLYCEGGYHPVNIGDVYHGKYAVLRKLGWGHFSTVWLCWDHQNSRFIALKILRSANVFTQVALREIDFLECANRNRSNNPHKVVRLLDRFLIFGTNGRHICMAFETLGYNLKEMIRQNKNKNIPLTSVKSILRQVLEALDYLHTTCNIIHTDIKPENICVDVNSKLTTAAWIKAGTKFSSPRANGDEVPVTLADLGNAVWRKDSNVGVIQTLPYRGPEVVLGAEFQANADVWSTACMAFELATGQYLFSPFCRNKQFSAEVYHLALIVGLLGDIPKRIALASEYSFGFFAASGKPRYAPQVNSCGLFERLIGEFEWDASEAREFSDFLLPMLAIDPKDRCSATNCLEHKWLKL